MLTPHPPPSGAPVNQGMIAPGNHVDFRFAARSTTPRGKVWRAVDDRPYKGGALMAISQGKICRKNLEKRSIFMKIPLYFWKNLW